MGSELIEHATVNLPKEVYYVAGVIILTNLGTIASIFFAAFKAVWWASKLDSRVTDAKATAVRAHKRIDILRLDAPEGDEPPEANQ